MARMSTHLRKLGGTLMILPYLLHHPIRRRQDPRRSHLIRESWMFPDLSLCHRRILDIIRPSTTIILISRRSGLLCDL